MSDTIRKALEAAEQALAHSYEVQFNPAEGTSEQDAALAAVRAALAQPQAAQPEAVAWPSKMKSEPLRADESVQDQECALRFVQGWNACLEACKSAATPPTEPAPQAEPAAVGELPPLPDGRIVEIRDEHLPSQGETFDCIAFARAVEREVRSALASAPHAREPLSDRAAQDDAYVCGRNEEAKRWEKAMHQTWQVVNPLNPAGQPGSYSRGYDNGFAAALEVLHGNLK